MYFKNLAMLNKFSENHNVGIVPVALRDHMGENTSLTIAHSGLNCPQPKH